MGLKILWDHMLIQTPVSRIVHETNQCNRKREKILLSSGGPHFPLNFGSNRFRVSFPIHDKDDLALSPHRTSAFLPPIHHCLSIMSFFTSYDIPGFASRFASDCGEIIA